MIGTFKNWQNLLPRKIHFCPSLGRKGPKYLQNRDFWPFCKIFVKLIFPGNKLIWKLILLLSYGPKCCRPIKFQDSLKCYISRKKWMMKFIFGMEINIEVVYKVILSFWVCIARHVRRTQNKFAYLCNIFRKTWELKLIFGLQINTKVFYKLIASPWVCIARDAQSTWNDKFAISLQYLKENITSTSLAPHLFLLGWLKLNLI